MTVKWLESSPRSAGMAPRNVATPIGRWVGGCLAALALIALLVPLRGSWVAQVLLVPLLLIVPGVILLRALRIGGNAVSSLPVYVPCGSLVVLLGSGLAVDLLGPLVGVSAPLRAAPLLAGLEFVCLVLLASTVNAPPYVAIPWRSLAQPERLAWPFLFPLAAAAGALRLNSGHGPGIAIAALSACVVLLILALAFARRLNKTLLAVILYAVGLALMWSFSLRGDLVYGFDISAEYYALQHAVLTGIWHTAHTRDAYGAMLSVTVMPAELHALSGVPALLVFKLVYPAIGALFPVGVFGLARRVLPRRWAFAAACLVVVQATFFQELPALARQEIALPLFVALVAAVLDGRIPRRSQWAWVALLGLAMAVSHYSTTYMAIGIFGITLVLLLAMSWLRKIPRLTGTVAVAFAAALVGAVLWYGPVTHSASNATQFVGTTQNQGLDLLPNQGHGGGPLSVLSSYLQATSQTSIQAARYAQLVHKEYVKSKSYVTPLPDAGSPRYQLRDSAPDVPAVRWLLGFNALNLGGLVVQQLVNLFGAVGALMMVLWRKATVIARRVGLISLATLAILALIRLSGTLAEEYNPERAFLQATVVIAITLCWSMGLLADRWSRRQPPNQWRLRQAAVLAVAAVSLVVLLVNNSGLAGAVLGGGTAINLANSGEDFERYDMTAPELTSASWLGEHATPGQLVYADRYAQLPLNAMIGTPKAMVSDVTPLTLDQHAWVYASTTNIIDGRARALFNNQFVTYVFPLRFLDGNYDTVYTNGSSEVFHR